MSKSRGRQARDWVKFDQRTNAYRKVARRQDQDRDAEIEIQEAKRTLDTPYNFRFN